MGFFIALAGMERGAAFLDRGLAPPCGRYFCIGILSKEEIFFIRRVTKNVYPSKWEASLPGVIMI